MNVRPQAPAAFPPIARKPLIERPARTATWLRGARLPAALIKVGGCVPTVSHSPTSAPPQGTKKLSLFGAGDGMRHSVG
jgi:hypothetical protein